MVGTELIPNFGKQQLRSSTCFVACLRWLFSAHPKQLGQPSHIHTHKGLSAKWFWLRELLVQANIDYLLSEEEEEEKE
jgi:hypothetical protein